MNIVTGTVTRSANHASPRRTPNWLKAVYAVLVAVVALVVVGAVVGPQKPSQSLPACEFEDSPHCYWDADTMGNGLGHDVVNK